MILLRCISFLIGSLIVIGAPFLLLPDAPQRPTEPGVVMAACTLVALLASGFFVVAVAGNYMKRSRRTRAFAAMLLLFPMLGSVAVLLLDDLPNELWLIGPLLCCAVFLFVTFIYPGKRGRHYRSLRPRDPSSIVNV